MPALTVFFFAAVLGTIVFIIHILSLERRKKMAAYAKSKDLNFSSNKDKKMDASYSSFKCLHRGHSRYAYNIMSGKQEGRDLTAFDYHYVTGHGKSRRVHNFSALIIRSPLPLKPLYLRPENIFDKVTEARSRALSSTGSPSSQAADENILVKGLHRLFAVSEGYPELKASRNFIELQKELANTEDRIQTSRRFYNGNVRDLNTRIEIFPSNLIAALFQFKRSEYFEIEEVKAYKNPSIDID